MHTTNHLQRPGNKGLSGRTLKFIAMLAMLLDHIGVAVIENGLLAQSGQAAIAAADIALRTAGRIAFPLFCFLLAEGFVHTSSVKRYFLRLCAFALLSELPFDLAVKNRWFAFESQNIFFTLAIGVLMLAGLRRAQAHPWIQACVLAACGAGAVLLGADYGLMGMLLIASFYLLRENRPLQSIAAATLTFCASVRYYGAGVLALPLLWGYSGKRGRPGGRYFFYCFYPAHLLLLFLIRYYLLGVSPS